MFVDVTKEGIDEWLVEIIVSTCGRKLIDPRVDVSLSFPPIHHPSIHMAVADTISIHDITVLLSFSSLPNPPPSV